MPEEISTSPNNSDQENLPPDPTSMDDNVPSSMEEEQQQQQQPRVDPRVRRQQETLVTGSATGESPEEENNIEIPQTQFYNCLKNNRISVAFITEVNPPKLPKDPAITPTLQAGFNSIDISHDGDILAASTADNQVVIIDLKDPKHLKNVFPVVKYGANHIHVIPNTRMMVMSSTKTNNDLRLMSFEVVRGKTQGSSQYIRYFSGHKGEVCSLDVTPDGRNIISATALEKKIFLWDILIEKPIGTMDFSGLPPYLPSFPDGFFGEDVTTLPRLLAAPQPVVAFDPSSSVFGVMLRSSEEVLKLYDLRNYGKGPFKSVQHDIFDRLQSSYPKDESKDLRMTAVTSLGADFNDMKFSPDGTTILINTNGPLFFLLDAFTGQLIHVIGRRYKEYNNVWTNVCGTTVCPEVSFTPDSKFVVGGNGTGNDPRIYVWSVDSGQEVGIINRDVRSEGSNPNFAVNYVKCNPRTLGLVTAGGRRISFYGTVGSNDTTVTDPVTINKT